MLLTDNNKISAMRQTNAGCLGFEISAILVLKLLGHQLQGAHPTFAERPSGRHHESTVNSRNIVPLLLTRRFVRKVRNRGHQKGIFLEAICRIETD